jgi:hypothetical protein
MRKLAIITAAAATMFCAGSLSIDRAEAANFGATTGVRLAAEDLNPVETAHYRHCWWGHGYRHCHRHYHHRHCWWRHGYRHCGWGHRY